MKGNPYNHVVLTRLAIIFSFLLFAFTTECSETCSKTCVARECDSVGIRYGKYCGIGYTGCPGEVPCDDVDACCKLHDECVRTGGMTNVKCSRKLRNCLARALKSGKVGFSKDCPYSTVVPLMSKAMDAAIILNSVESVFKNIFSP
ncbi:hypothetical protein SLA2020_110820 [Shorea laevis]